METSYRIETNNQEANQEHKATLLDDPSLMDKATHDDPLKLRNSNFPSNLARNHKAQNFI
jgi:hypothetical protein